MSSGIGLFNEQFLQGIMSVSEKMTYCIMKNMTAYTDLVIFFISERQMLLEIYLIKSSKDFSRKLSVHEYSHDRLLCTRC